MLSLFSPAGRKALAALPAHKTLLAFDFDGTLAPLVQNPDDAFTYKEMLPALRRLERKRRLAVISGRGVRDARKRLLFKPDFLVGNHGLEGLHEFKDKAKRAVTLGRVWLKQLKRDLKLLPADHGIYVEDKKHSLSIHYRHAKDPKRMAAWIADSIDNLHPSPRVVGGKLIYNVMPKGSPHKGKALKALMKRLGCTHAIFVGDDVTDEDAFREKGRILSVRVGKSRDSHAAYYVKDEKEVTRLLNELAERFS